MPVRGWSQEAPRRGGRRRKREKSTDACARTSLTFPSHIACPRRRPEDLKTCRHGVALCRHLAIGAYAGDVGEGILHVDGPMAPGEPPARLRVAIGPLRYSCRSPTDF